MGYSEMNVSSTISIEVDFSVESHMILGPKIDSLTENVSLGLHYKDLWTEDLSACITFRDIQSALNDGDKERPKNKPFLQKVDSYDSNV